MNLMVSENTKALLLLVAPLLMQKTENQPDILTHGEFRKLNNFLKSMDREPKDLLEQDATDLITACRPVVDVGRIRSLLDRGFLLSQAIERWHSMSIWVVGCFDDDYPKRLINGLKDNIAPILYGCGDILLLKKGGLAVVGSRHVDETLEAYAESVGALAASAGIMIISGAARGIDQASMRGALQNNGKVVGVMADSLERTVLNRENRQFIMNGFLTVVSPYDPCAGFNVGNAMQRNKFIYALSNAALVVSSEYQKGGTWAGAGEQLNKFNLLPVYVRSTKPSCKALDALKAMGAYSWPEPSTPQELKDLLIQKSQEPIKKPEQIELHLLVAKEDEADYRK